MTRSKYNLMIVMMAITFLGSACAQSIRVSNYCDLPSNYAGSKLYYDHPEVLAQVDSVDHALFIDRVNLLAKATNQEKVTPVGDHAYIVGDVAHTRMLIIMLDKRGCIVNKIPLSPGYYEFIMAIDDKLVFLQRSGVV